MLVVVTVVMIVIVIVAVIVVVTHRDTPLPIGSYSADVSRRPHS
jgi:hypothetical protein